MVEKEAGAAAAATVELGVAEVVGFWEDGWPFLGGSLGNDVTPSAENCRLFTLACTGTHTHSKTVLYILYKDSGCSL